MKKLLLSIVIMCCGMLAMAQLPRINNPSDTMRRVVTGIVQTEDSLPVTNADVVFKNRSSSVFTNDAGQFTLEGLGRDSVLVVAKEGYLPVELPLSQDSLLSGLVVRLVREPDYIQAGYGRIDRRITTGAYGRVGSGLLLQSTSTSFDAALTGRLAGLQAVTASGVTASMSALRLRGVNSIVTGSEPLILVDGVPIVSGSQGDGLGSVGNNYGYQTSPLAELNNYDIDNITILKDAGAAGVYGARGANGVILVTTRRGRAGRTRFDLDYYGGAVSFGGKKPSLLNGSQYESLTRQAYERTFGAAPTNKNYLQGGRDFGDYQLANTNALDQALQGGAVNNLNLSASGGNKRVNFFLSGNYRKERGLIKGSSFDRFSTRFNADNQATDNLRLGISNVLSLSQGYMPNSGLDSSGGYGAAQYRSLPVHPLRFAQSGLALNPYPFNPFFQPYQLTNIATTQDRDYFENDRRVFRNAGALYASYDLAKGLTFRTELGLDYFSNIDRSYRSRFVRLTQRRNNLNQVILEPSAMASDFRDLYFTLFTNNTLTFNREFNQRHNLLVQLGHSYQRTIHTWNGTASENFPNDYSKLVSAGAIPFGLPVGGEDGFAFVGYFARAQYALDKKYLLGASLRADASSRYGEDAGLNGYGLFPTLSAGWVISQEDFLRDNTTVNYLKLRGSVGRLGNSLIGNQDAQGYWRGGTNFVDPPSRYPGQTPYRLANPNLSWENHDMANLGIESQWLNRRLLLELDLFTRTNQNAIIDYPTAPTLGVDYPFYRSKGARLNTKGIELTLSTLNVDGDFKWTTDFNVTFLRSSVIDLGNVAAQDAPMAGYGANDVIAANGQRISTYYLARYAGIAGEDDANGRWVKGDELLLDKNGNRFRPTSVAAIDSARVMITDKPVMPTFYGGLNNTLSYRGFEFSFLFTYTVGNYVLDQGERLQSYITGENNLLSSQASRGANLYYSGTSETGQTYLDPMSQRNTTANLHRADFVRLRYISLAYSLPERAARFVGVERARVYVAAQNLFIFTPFKGGDPEVVGNAATPQLRNMAGGITAFDLPQSRSIVGGLSFTF